MKASEMVLDEAETAYAYAYREHLNTGCDTPADDGLDVERAELIRETLLRAQRDRLRSGWPKGLAKHSKGDS